MAEQQTDKRTDRRVACGHTRRGGFSSGLFFVGLLALGLSAWALAGPTQWGLTTVVPIGWIVVAVAIVVGLALVVSPRRRR
ncbi:hypothetical protein NLM24_10525 [Nocardia zapadnayensis]|uniref:hypothetical protein n=1 Tax=Nocardia rhamnosiphila TaxID=426716 RepID=UPI002246DDBF|nr:hypothetical protein [Nocardia zapadnayensis]MCX0271131.1 hypothetical protein [Nocardia zapadnayensis]